METFKAEDSVMELFGELQKYFLPSFFILVCSRDKKDLEMVDLVRSSWCEVLSIDYPGLTPLKLGNFFYV